MKLAKEAGVIMKQHAAGDQQVTIKQDSTPVTIADTTINHMVIERVRQQFPDDEIIGEEESTDDYGMGRRWICDPIDGTAAYIMGLPSATFSLCLAVDGQPTVAVAYEPLRDQLYTAVRGQGSMCNNHKLQVSNQSFSDGLIALAPDYIRPDLINMPFVQKLLTYDKELAIFPGAVYRSCMVAEGRIVGFPHPKVKPHDIAAVHLIVEEAGGKVTSIYGEPLDYSQRFEGAVISNGIAHKGLLELFNDSL